MSEPRRRSRQRRAWLLLVVVLLMINLPLAHSAWNRWRLQAAGTEVTAEVAREAVGGSGAETRYFVGFRLPEEIDGEPVPERFRRWSAQVDQDSYDLARRTGQIQVRVLADRPSVFRAQGQVRSSAGLVVGLLANVLVLAVALLLRRFRGQLRAPLTLVATGDAVVRAGGPLLERDQAGQYVVRGAVTGVEGDQLQLDVGDRTIRVDLDGHQGDVGLDETVEVRGHLVD